LVQYSFKGGKEHRIKQHQHRNSKGNAASTIYVRTWASTKSLVKNLCQENKPRKVMYKTVTEELGGIVSCSSVGHLRQNRQQIKDFARNQSNDKECKNLSGEEKTDNPWYRLLSECKSQAANKPTAFIRDVRVAPEPLCVMTTDRQLSDLKPFCCNSLEYRPFTVDLTFDIGNYDITPITYQLLWRLEQMTKRP
jgi:hypothetical protein